MGIIPRWEYRLNGQHIVYGCKTFEELNEIFLCDLTPLPDHDYIKC